MNHYHEKSQKFQYELLDARNNLIDIGTFYAPVILVYENFKSFRKGITPFYTYVDAAQQDVERRIGHTLYKNGIYYDPATLPAGFRWSAWRNDNVNYSKSLSLFGQIKYHLKLSIIPNFITIPPAEGEQSHASI